MAPMKPMPPMEPMEPMKPMEPMEPFHAPSAGWWPAELGAPESSGAQLGWRYAYFPRQRRLAVERDGHVIQYDTADHLISGVSQRGSGDDAGPIFTSQHGSVTLDSLRKV